MFIKFILLKFIKINLFYKVFPCIFKGCFLSIFQSGFPFIPTNSTFTVLNCHIKTIIVQPVRIFFNKVIIYFIFLKTFKSLFQRFKSRIIDFFIINKLCLISEIIFFAFFFCQKTFFY